MKFAAIDIGSNAGRMAIVRVWKVNDQWQQHQVEFVRFALRLGDHVFQEGSIPTYKQEKLEKLITAFRLLMELHEVDAYNAYATSALREAKNGAEVAAKIKTDCGIDLQLISGSKEAELIFMAHKHLLADLERFLFIDVGGGSTELTLFQGTHLPVQSKSFDLGTVRMLDHAERDGIWEEMAAWIATTVPMHIPMVAVGTGGNINKIFGLAENRPNDRYLNIKRIEEVYGMLNSLTLKERVEQLGLNPDRADVILPAAEIYLFVMRQARLRKMLVSGLGLRDGMIYELAEKHAHQF